MSLVKSAVLSTTLALLGSGLMVGVAQADPAPPPAPAPAPAPAPVTTIDHDGLFAVGKDIVPGNYATPGPVADGACSWRRADASGTTVDNSISKKPQVITISPTDATFRTRGCQAWAPTDEAPPAPVSNLQAQIMIGALNGLSAGRTGGAPNASAPAAPAGQPPAAPPAAAPAPGSNAPAAPALTAPTPTPAAPSG